MLKKINILPKEEFFYAIGVSNRNDTSKYTVLAIALKDDELKIENRFSSHIIDAAFKAKLTKNGPVLLHIDGDLVISKIVDDKVGYRNNIIFKSNPDDFYFYEYRQDHRVFASVCRKNKIEAYLNEIANLNLFVLHLAVGPFVMANLLPLLKEQTVIASEFDSLQLSENKIEALQEKEATQKQFTINKEKFSEREVPLLASFFDYKYPNSAIDIETDFTANNASEYEYKKWFKIGGTFALGFIMITLFISHFLNSHYQNELAQKQFEYSNAQQTTNEINQLKEEIILKEKILLNNRISNKNFITKYLSDISNSVPESITLLDISVFPKTRKTRPNEKINFFSNTLNIVGEALNDHTFNEWTKELKNKKWVTKMEIVEYNQSNRMNTFKIKITL